MLPPRKPQEPQGKHLKIFKVYFKFILGFVLGRYAGDPPGSTTYTYSNELKYPNPL